MPRGKCAFSRRSLFCILHALHEAVNVITVIPIKKRFPQVTKHGAKYVESSWAENGKLKVNTLMLIQK